MQFALIKLLLVSTLSPLRPPWGVCGAHLHQADRPCAIGVIPSLVVRLQSEIDQIHLSIEAQCVTTLLPMGDCHSKLGRHELHRPPHGGLKLLPALWHPKRRKQTFQALLL